MTESSHPPVTNRLKLPNPYDYLITSFNTTSTPGGRERLKLPWWPHWFIFTFSWLTLKHIFGLNNLSSSQIDKQRKINNAFDGPHTKCTAKYADWITTVIWIHFKNTYRNKWMRLIGFTRSHLWGVQFNIMLLSNSTTSIRRKLCLKAHTVVFS